MHVNHLLLAESSSARCVTLLLRSRSILSFDNRKLHCLSIGFLEGNGDTSTFVWLELLWVIPIKIVGGIPTTELPDFQFFVFSLTSSGGHQAWHAPTEFYSRREGTVHSLDDYL